MPALARRFHVKNFMFKRTRASLPDMIFLLALFVLIVFGLTMLSSASWDSGRLKHEDGLYFLKRQLVYGVAAGLILFFIGFSVDYHKISKFVFVLLVLNLIFLLLVFTPLGGDYNGGRRWLAFGPVSFQPGELLKFTFIFYVAAWLANNKKRATSFFGGFLPFLMLSGVTGLLIVMQPATTTGVIVFASALVTYFVGGGRIKFLGLFILIGVLAVAAVLLITKDYRLKRITSFLSPEKTDELGSGYHRNQALTAVGSGGLFGVGYGKSTTKIKYLPEPEGDSIFAVIAEELGFFGSSLTLLLFSVLFFRGLKIAREARDSLGCLLVIGFSSVIAVQTIINVGAISGVFPLTGVPLPFVSYGSSAFATMMLISGIILNVSRYRK